MSTIHCLRESASAEIPERTKKRDCPKAVIKAKRMTLRIECEVGIRLTVHYVKVTEVVIRPPFQ